MNCSRILNNTLYKKNSNFIFSSFSFSGSCHPDSYLTSLQCRSIFSTTQLQNSWMNKIKGVFTGKNSSQEEIEISSESFTLLRFADELKNARRVGAFKQYIVGRSSEATFADAFEKQEAIIRYLGGFDSTGENIQSCQKQEAAKHCNCTIAEVENALAKFTWAREAQKKIENLKKEGKPMPKSIAEVQKLMGSSPLDLARSNLAKSGQISRNALCPCGSKKRYKWYFSYSKILKNAAAFFPNKISL
ncbi:hypothetical protein FNV43_RR04815 [Rhamnella rubrinervis]|uniref:Uncharacterized protein n=1 Tax=Rhamnella rubrinervis TaxID=2594499 RepID=A0A8K0HLT7_9ROSA|nr:hypothetical protein FNV43_RR04815 [Rhamnella rubrinervis]